MHSFLVTCAPREDSDKPVHQCSQLTVFTVHSMVAKSSWFLHVNIETDKAG